MAGCTRERRAPLLVEYAAPRLVDIESACVPLRPETLKMGFCQEIFFGLALLPDRQGNVLAIDSECLGHACHKLPTVLGGKSIEPGADLVVIRLPAYEWLDQPDVLSHELKGPHRDRLAMRRGSHRRNRILD
jgi:hypothetical protein